MAVKEEVAEAIASAITKIADIITEDVMRKVNERMEDVSLSAVQRESVREICGEYLDGVDFNDIRDFEGAVENVVNNMDESGDVSDSRFARKVRDIVRNMSFSVEVSDY